MSALLLPAHYGLNSDIALGPKVPYPDVGQAHKGKLALPHRAD